MLTTVRNAYRRFVLGGPFVWSVGFLCLVSLLSLSLYLSLFSLSQLELVSIYPRPDYHNLQSLMGLLHPFRSGSYERWTTRGGERRDDPVTNERAQDLLRETLDLPLVEPRGGRTNAVR